MTAPFEKKTPGPDIHTTVSGHVTLAVGKEDGPSREVRADFPNMVLDGGLERFARIGAYDLIKYAHVGSSGAAVNASQTSLSAWIASVGLGLSYSLVSEDPYVIEGKGSGRFGAGVAKGNIAEVGFGDDRSQYGALFSRALVLDESGLPSAVTVLADEYLDVTYVLTFVVDVSDVPFTMNLSTGPVSGVLRRAHLPSLGGYYGYLSSMLSQSVDRVSRISNGSLGPSTGGVTNGTEYTQRFYQSSSHRLPYVPGSLYSDSEVIIDVTEGNLPSGGFSAMGLYYETQPGFQLSFDPPVPKTDERVFKFGIRISVGRG